MHVTFIGMSGAGKSYVGAAYAKEHGMRFIDIDTVTESEYDMPLQAVLDELGEQKFLAEQEQTVVSLALDEPTVIAPGGSVVYSPTAMRFLKDHSTIVYLRVPCEVIEARVETDGRGIVGLGTKTFAELYAERAALYETWADVIVDSAAMSLPELLSEIAVQVQQ